MAFRDQRSRVIRGNWENHPWHPHLHVCLLRIRATTWRFWLIMLIAHTPSTLSVWLWATPSMKTATGNTGVLDGFTTGLVPAGTVEGAILACLLEFEWHCGGITQLFRQHLMHGHRWHIVHGAGEISIGFTLSGSSPTMSSVFPEAFSSVSSASHECFGAFAAP